MRLRDAYDVWNDAIGHCFFSSAMANRNVYLVVDEARLDEIARASTSLREQIGSERPSEHFYLSVRERVRRQGWSFRTGTQGRFPSCLGLLAVQVLAVYRMQDRDTVTDQAYWFRLNELLGEGRRGLPKDLTHSLHQELWRDGLEDWANQSNQGRWGKVVIPRDERVGHRHIRLPKSQALLTLADLHRLNAAGGFWERSGLMLQPDPPERSIRTWVDHLKTDPACFKTHAARVLADPDRAQAAYEQIVREWPNRVRMPAAEEARARTPRPPRLTTQGALILALDMPRRNRAGHCYAHIVADGQEDRPVALGEVLAHKHLSTGGLTYQHAAGRPLLAAFDAFREQWRAAPRLEPGCEFVAIVPFRHLTAWLEDLKNRVDEPSVLHAVSDAPSRPQETLCELPRGWALIKGTLKLFQPRPYPSWLEDEDVRLVGGLRTAHRRWLAGAGPAVCFARTPSAIIVDGERFRVSASEVTSDDLSALGTLGKHLVTVPGTNSSVEFDVEAGADRVESIACGWISKIPGSWPGISPTVPADCSPNVHIVGPVVWAAVRPAAQPAAEETRVGGEPPQVPHPARRWLVAALRRRGFSDAVLLRFGYRDAVEVAAAGPPGHEPPTRSRRGCWVR